MSCDPPKLATAAAKANADAPEQAVESGMSAINASPGILDRSEEQDENQQSPHIPTDVAVRLVDHYLAKLHNRPHSLFHSATLRQQARDGHIKKSLLLAICSMGARFDHEEYVRSSEKSYMDEAKRLLVTDLENICIENVQTCILLANLFAAHLNPSSETLFFRIAISLLQLMDTGSGPETTPLIHQEVKRRACWTLYMADRWSSSSLGLPPQLHDADLSVDLPMDETIFESLSHDDDKLHSPWRPGIWAHKISLVRLFGQIQELNRRSVNGGITPAELESNVASLSRKLEEWEETIPSYVRMNAENLERYVGRGLGGAFVALHLGYHHYATLLYFRFLKPVTSSSSPSAAMYHSRCRAHAFAYSDLVKLARQRQDCHVVYPTVGHMAVVSSSVLLHVLLFGADEELRSAREALNANFEAILELSRYWPNTGQMIQRLVTFQDYCLLSTDYRTHRLDGWMLRFLIEYSRPLGEKDVAPVTSGMNHDMDTFSARTRAVTEQGRYTIFEVGDQGFNSIEGQPP